MPTLRSKHQAKVVEVVRVHRPLLEAMAGAFTVAQTNEPVRVVDDDRVEVLPRIHRLVLSRPRVRGDPNLGVACLGYSTTTSTDRTVITTWHLGPCMPAKVRRGCGGNEAAHLKFPQGNETFRRPKRTASGAVAVTSGPLVTTDTGTFQETGVITGRVFRIKNTSAKPIRGANFVVHYYDASGKELKLDGQVIDLGNNVAFGDPIAPGDTREIALGEKQKDEPNKTARAEAIARKVVFDDKTEWNR